MYIHSFKVISPHRLSEAIKFNQQYHKYEDVPDVQDKLRWCRYHMGLSQKEVADLIGINRSVYINYENGKTVHYKKEIVDKLARLYNVPVDDFLDDYSRFLYYSQEKAMWEYREVIRKTENK